MMREILFKAKRIDNGEWVEGNHVYLENAHYIVPLHIEWNEDEQKETPMFIRIYRETLCQYTGLEDKNGKRIWENDIVTCEHEKFQEGDAVEQYPFPDTIRYKRNYAVEFINTGSNYGYRLRNKSIHFILTGNVVYNHKIEVLGNIFDNPELLGQDGENH